MSTPHDGLFRKTFEHPDTVRQSLVPLLPKRIRSHFDWSTLQILPESFVAEDLRNSCADLLCQVSPCSPTEASGDTYLYFLCEHFSNRPEDPALRLLHYCAAIWERHKNTHGPESRPEILPVILTHSLEPWLRTGHPHPQRFAATYRHRSAALRTHSLDFGYSVIDVPRLPPSRIVGPPHAQLALHLFRALQNHARFAALARLDHLWSALAETQLKTLLHYLLKSPRIDTQSLKIMILHMQTAPVREQLKSLEEQLIEEGFERGIEKGIERGLQALRSSLRKALTHRQITLSPDQVATLDTLDDPARLEHLIELAYTAPHATFRSALAS